MAFRFRLDKVLKLRRQVVDRISQDVAAAARVVSGLQDQIKALDHDIQQQQTLSGPVIGQSVHVKVLLDHTHWLDHLEDIRNELLQELSEAQAELGVQRGRLTAAWRDVEVLVKLEEKQRRQWQEEQAKLDTAALDEIGQIRAERQRRQTVVEAV